MRWDHHDFPSYHQYVAQPPITVSRWRHRKRSDRDGLTPQPVLPSGLVSVAQPERPSHRLGQVQPAKAFTSASSAKRLSLGWA